MSRNDPESIGVMCGNCGLVLNESTDTPSIKRSPCKNCSSTIRQFNLQCMEKIKPLALIDAKKRSPGFSSKNKLRIHLQKGDQINHDTGRWVLKERIINREKNPATYFEQIVDRDSGEVIHNDEGPLNQHQGHWSDRMNKNTIDRKVCLACKHLLRFHLNHGKGRCRHIPSCKCLSFKK
jgi:hypothetical protein